MERLTERDEFGNADIIGVDSADLQLNLDFDAFNRVTEALNRLAYYEDLEEQGRLVVLPCKVGDTVWGVVYDTRDCPNCVGIGGCFGCSKANPIDVYRTDFKLHMVEEIGRTLFLTRAEAEAAMEGENT